jgi:large subunit ribosomal protein L18
MRLTKQQALKRRHLHVRRKISGTPERPRLSIRKSLRHLYAQLVDDIEGRTLLFITSNTKGLKAKGQSFCNIATAKEIGQTLGKQAKEKGISRVVFDRGGCKYHGVVKALADAVRAEGIKF